MDPAELDEQFDKVLALIPLAKEQEPLEEIATTLDVNVADEIAAGNKRAIYRKILAHLNSADFDGEAERERLILSVRDTIQAHLGFDAGIPKLEDSDDDGSEEDRARQTREEEEAKEKVRNRSQMAVLSGVRLKEFKFDGSVGYPGEKGKLDYAGVMHNINMGQQRGFDETEICSAAIRAITPGHPTRTYLEGRTTLTLEKVKSSFQAHFIQRDVTDIYNDMVHAIQGSGPKDTAMSFVLTMFSLRDRIIDFCKDKRSGERKYTPKLVQGEMQKSIYNGLKDDNIRQDLKQILKQKKLDDDDLLREVREAMISKAERDKKFLEAASKRKPNVSAVQVQSSDSDNQTPTKQNNNSNNKNNSKKTTNSKSNLPLQNLDPFMAQLSSVIGSHVQGIVAPLQSQIQDLTKFKDKCESQKNSGPQVQQLNVQAPAFKSNQNGDGGNSVGGGSKPPVGGVVSPVGSGNVVGNAGAAVSEEFLTNLFRSVMNCGSNNGNNGNRNSNRNNYRNNNNNNGNNTCNGVVLNSKCNICRTAGALFCNHCRICHAVDHRTPTCPHRTDPNYVPKN